MAQAIMHLGDETHLIQKLERAIQQTDSDATNDIVLHAVELAIEQVKQRIARNRRENEELEAGIARLRSFTRRRRASLALVGGGRR